MNLPWCRPRPQKLQPPAQPRTIVTESLIIVKAGIGSRVGRVRQPRERQVVEGVQLRFAKRRGGGLDDHRARAVELHQPPAAEGALLGLDEPGGLQQPARVRLELLHRGEDDSAVERQRAWRRWRRGGGRCRGCRRGRRCPRTRQRRPGGGRSPERRSRPCRTRADPPWRRRGWTAAACPPSSRSAPRAAGWPRCRRARPAARGTRPAPAGRRPTAAWFGRRPGSPPAL